MENQQNKRDVIDLSSIFKKLLKKKKYLAIYTLAVGILASVIIVQVPRYYRSEVMLAPEVGGVSGVGGALGSIASSFGFDMGDQATSDAIYPMLYPDLFGSNDFIVKLFDIKVKTIDGSVETDYYDYLDHYQESAIWQPIVTWFKSLFKQKSKLSGIVKDGGDGRINPFLLSERQSTLVESVKNKIQCSIDKKTNVITITVTDQDPLVSATLVDSVRQRLQAFITEYRTSKAHDDYEYYAKLAQEAKQDYDTALRKYAVYCDTHKDMIWQTSLSERDDLENDMQIKYNAYNALITQLQASKAKIQESTPAFTILQSASVPVKPAGPKRMMFVLGMMVLAFIITSVVYVRKELFPFSD